MRISDWSSDVCSSDLLAGAQAQVVADPLRRAVALVGVALVFGVEFVEIELAGVVHQLGYVQSDVGATATQAADRKSVVSGKRVSVRVDLGGRRIIKKKTNTTQLCVQ